MKSRFQKKLLEAGAGLPACVLPSERGNKKVPPLHLLSLANQSFSAPFKAAEFISKRVSRATCLALSFAFLFGIAAFGKIELPRFDVGYTYDGARERGDGVAALAAQPEGVRALGVK